MQTFHEITSALNWTKAATKVGIFHLIKARVMLFQLATKEVKQFTFALSGSTDKTITVSKTTWSWCASKDKKKRSSNKELLKHEIHDTIAPQDQ